MASGDEGGSSTLGALSRNWRSALVVNGLFDALEETERQRDELAHCLSKRNEELPLFDTTAETESGDGDSVCPSRDRDIRSGVNRFGNGVVHNLDSSSREAPKKRAPPLLRHSLLGSPPPAADVAPTTRSSQNSGRRVTNAGEAAHDQQTPRRRRRGGGATGSNDDDPACDTASAEQMPPPSRRTEVSTSGFQSGFPDSRQGDSNIGDDGNSADMSHAHGVRSGGRLEEDEEEDLGLSAASVGYVAGELRGGELERVRGRVADLGAAIEMSQSKLLRELSQVQEDFFSSFGYTPSLGASAATSAGGSGGVAVPDSGGNGGSGSGVGFSFAISSIPPFAGGASSHNSTLDRSRLQRWGQETGNGAGGRCRITTSTSTSTSTSPRARPPLRRRDLDEATEEGEEHKARSSMYHSGVGTKPLRGRSGAGGRSGRTRAWEDKAAAAATVDGASYAFPAEASSPKGGGGKGRGGGQGHLFSVASSPRMVRRNWKSLSPSPRSANAAVGGWPREALSSARRAYVESAGVDDLREQLLAELVEKEDLARELEDCRREAEEFHEREGHREGEMEELVEREAEERRARREAETELEHLRVSHRSLEEKFSGLAEKADALEQRSTELERRSAQLEEKTTAQGLDISRRAAELEKVSAELQQKCSELGQATAELGEVKGSLGETKGVLGEKAAALERALSQLGDKEARLGEAADRQRELEADRDRSAQELRDLRGVYENFQTVSSERSFALSERAASALMRERGMVSLRAAIWQWRAIALKSDLGTAVMISDWLKLRKAKRDAFGAWVDLRGRRSHARALMSRLIQRQAAVDRRGALRQWARQAAAAAAAAASAALRRAEAEKARLKSAASLSEALARGRRRSMERGFGKLRDGVAVSLMKSQALRRLTIGRHHRGLGLLSAALSRWRRQVSTREVTAAALLRAARHKRRRELAGAFRRWGGVVGAEGAVERLAGRVERAVRKARIARAVLVWREECHRRRAEEMRKAEERCRRVLSGGLAMAARRNLLTRCLMAWKAYAVTRRCQLRSARSFLLARNRRIVRLALVAWRDGRRTRAEAARALWNLGKAFRTAALREGLRRLEVSARWRERQEAATIVSLAKFETEELRRERDGMGSRLLEVTEEVQRVVRQRVKLEQELVRRQRLAFGRECFGAWKTLVQAEKRKEACLVRIMHRNRHGLLQEAFLSWRDGTRGAAAMAMVERVVTKNVQRKLLQKTLRVWSEGARRRQHFAAVFSRAARAVSMFERRQQRKAFTAWRSALSAWRVAAEGKARRAVDISGACARLRAVRKRPGRLQLANAFSVWARLSAISSNSDRRAQAASSAKRDRILRSCLSALRSNATLRRRARQALSSIDRRCNLRRLAKGWGGLLNAAAVGSAERRVELRLSKAEAAVATARMVARVRAHRTARRLLGVARGRAALEAFVAWRGLVREGRGARLGAAALAGRSRRRRLREAFACWREEASASARLRSRTLTRIFQAGRGLVSEAFAAWRAGSRAARGKAKALTALARIYEQRRLDRTEIRLALKSWRQNACGSVGDGGECGGHAGDGRQRGGGFGGVVADGLEAVAGVFVEAAAAFSTASSIPQVFELVEDFVSAVSVSSSGRLLLLSGEPGGNMFCLESERRAPPDEEPLEASFPIGNGLVSRCVATGLAFQVRHGGNGSNNADSGVLDIALVGPADLHALPLQGGYDAGFARHHHHSAPNGLLPQPLSVSLQGWKKPGVAGPGPDSASTVPPPPASWGDRRNRSPDGSPVRAVDSGGGGRGRSRLAFFPASDDCGSSRSPSPGGRRVGAARGYGFLSNSPPPPPVGGVAGRGDSRWWSESESPPPRQRRLQQQQRRRSPSPVKAGGIGSGVRGEEEVLSVACLPVTGGDGGQAMIGVIKVWREQQQQQQHHGGDKGRRLSDQAFSGGEMAALAVVAGQAAAALRRLAAEATERAGVLREVDAAAADRVDETQKRDEAVKEEVTHLREAMEHLSGSAKGLAKQRDDARAALARAKGTLRRMVPALREVRDRQLGFRHYHDLIVNMSRAVLVDDDGLDWAAEEESSRIPRLAGATGSAPPSDRGLEGSVASPKGRVAAAMSLARGGKGRGRDRSGPAILTVLRETAAAGGGKGVGAGTLMQERGRSRERHVS